MYYRKGGGEVPVGEGVFLWISIHLSFPCFFIHSLPRPKCLLIHSFVLY